MVLMKYCNVCGLRVSDDDIHDGNGGEVDGVPYCKAHLPARPSASSRKKSGKQKTSSRGYRRPSTTADGSGPRKSKSQVLNRPTRSGARRRAAEEPDTADDQTGSSRMTQFIIIGGLIVAALVVVLIMTTLSGNDQTGSGSDRPARQTPEPTPVTKPQTPDNPPPVNPPVKPSNPKPVEPVVVPVPPPVAPVIADRDFPNPDDIDGDGIPDSFEKLYNLDPKKIDDSLDDADGDGFSNLLEYLYGSGIRNPESTPRLKTGTEGVTTDVKRQIVIGRNGRGVLADGFFYPFGKSLWTDKSTLITIGHSVPKEINRAFVQFDLTALAGIKYIESASLVLAFRHFTEQDKSGTFPDTLVFGALNKTLPVQGEYSPDIFKEFEIVKGTESVATLKEFYSTDMVEESFDVTPAVKYWVEQKGENCGLLFKYQDEAKSWRERKWYDRRQSGGAVSPRLEVSAVVSETKKSTNRPPVITERTPDPRITATVGEALKFTVAAQDSDGESAIIKYEWFSSASLGFKTPSATGQAFVFNGFSKPGVYLVAVRVTDSAGDYVIDGFYVTVR